MDVNIESEGKKTVILTVIGDDLDSIVLPNTYTSKRVLTITRVADNKDGRVSCAEINTNSTVKQVAVHASQGGGVGGGRV